MTTRNHWAACLCAAFLAAAAGTANLDAQQPAPAERQAAGSPREGIGVSGYWKIDVRNPDGSLVSHTEFENALTSRGQRSLVELLTFGSPVLMSIELNGGLTQPCGSGASGLPCFIDGASLTSSVQTNPSGALILTGSTIATNDGYISVVSTNTTYAGCIPTFGNVCSQPFTRFNLSDESLPDRSIPVAFGQVIQVSVTLSFS